MDEVAKHTTESDCWIVVNGEVLDVTSFLSKHPGGKQVLLIWVRRSNRFALNMPNTCQNLAGLTFYYYYYYYYY
jgi:hypothetical protein